MEEYVFPEERILSAQKFVTTLQESNRNGTRFCFILGAGASADSRIPSGKALEMRWMNALMGEKADGGFLQTRKETEEIAKTLKRTEKIRYDFADIVRAWEAARGAEQDTLPSEYYFDLYKLRFYPEAANGYRYMEKLIEKGEPSAGYHPLALLLADSNLNNLVITTNFDSLVEDALFLFTDKKPLVVNHESLADYISANINRPIVAKIHRGVMFKPLNSWEDTQKLPEEWKSVLSHAFYMYKPVVIGYNGGDNSLMDFMKDAQMPNGIYWCCRKNGYLVSIAGFDALMLELGKTFFPDRIAPTATKDYLENRANKRADAYAKRWDELDEDPAIKPVVEPLNEAEQQDEDRREESGGLTAWDYRRRGVRLADDEKYEDAIKAYTKAIELDPTDSFAYCDRGYAYDELGQSDKAIEDFSKAIELDPTDSAAYNNRGITYQNRGELVKAIYDYSEAIRFNPTDSAAYSNRGIVYRMRGQYERAIRDYDEAIRLDPKFIAAYNNRGWAYYVLGRFERAIEDCSEAIRLDPKYKDAYLSRAEAYRAIGETALAEADEEAASRL